MINFFSSWVKTLGLAIIIVSILEMLLPNNKTKKYIRMVMEIYILLAIISPFISNKTLDINNIDFENYVSKETSTTVNQTSMEKRIEELYIEQLEKDITKKLEQQGYKVKSCKVNAQISDKEEENKISQIKIEAEKSSQEEKKDNLENQIVTQIQKIKPVDISANDEKNKSDNNEKEKKLDKSDIQNIKKILIKEYEVNEKCLKIN